MAINVLTLLNRGYTISIEHGRLTIRSATNTPAPDDWLKRHAFELTREVLLALNFDAFEYTGYSTGYYSKNKWPGVTMQFSSVTTGGDAYAIFNVELNRARGTHTGKKQDPLPKKQFRVSKRHEFYKFWMRTELRFPTRLSNFHDYMGNLKGLLFVAPIQNGRLINKQICLLEIEADTIRQAFFPNSIQTSSGQHPDNIRTRIPDKESALSLTDKGLQPIQSTCAPNYGNTATSKNGYQGVDTVVKKKLSVVKWLADYEAYEAEQCTANAYLKIRGRG